MPNAPTDWIISTLAHLDMIRRADVMMRGEQWQLSVLQDDAARVTDALLLELGRRVNDVDE